MQGLTVASVNLTVLGSAMLGEVDFYCLYLSVMVTRYSNYSLPNLHGTRYDRRSRALQF